METTRTILSTPAPAPQSSAGTAVNIEVTSPSSATPTPRKADVFATTRWTKVLAARGDSAPARQALSDLCAIYYEPVVAYLRHEGRREDAARELAHRFFERLLQGRAFAAADPAQGRFRAYLLGAVKHFLAESHRNAHAAKRGHGVAPLPLGMDHNSDSSAILGPPDPRTPPPDTFFDRQWATTLVDHAAAALAAEWAARDQTAAFQLLKPWLLGESPGRSRAETAAGLGLSEGALKVAIHRLRRRFRDLVKAEIAQTVTSPDEAQAELHYLVEVLGSDYPGQ